MVDSLGSTANGLTKAVHNLVAFFTSPDNLMAMAVCLLALVGIYSLLRSEHVIPGRGLAPRYPRGRWTRAR